MARKVRPVLQEILAAIHWIEAAITGKTFTDFQSGWLLRHGVQRGIEIISEASRHLPAALLASSRNAIFFGLRQRPRDRKGGALG
jgi:uncharacterized protein with HEPN domain